MSSPAFRFYPSDFWGSPDVQAMELHEVGAYVSLLSNAWLSERPGTLPNDDERLRRWSRLTRDQWMQSRDLLLGKFPVNEYGDRVNPRLFLDYQKAEAYRASQSANGRKGGRPKTGEKPRVSETNPSLSFGLSQTQSQKKLAVAVAVTEKNKDKNIAELRPAFIPLEDWEAYIAARKTRKHPCTAFALGRIAGKLRKIHEAGQDAVAALEHSTLGGYPSVYPPSERVASAPAQIKFSKPEEL